MEKLLSVIIPAYNEQDALKGYLKVVIDFCESKGFDLIVVNDGSKDDTARILDSFSSHQCLKVISHKVNKGYGGAIKSGVLAAESKYVITIDADGQHNLEDVSKLLDIAVEKDADMIVGNRDGVKENLYRKTGKRIIRMIARFLMPINIVDINSGMKLYDAVLGKRYLKLCPDGMAYSDVIALVFISQRHLVLEENITINQRIAGVSTIGTATAIDTVKEILNIVVLFNPMRIFLPLSILFIIAGTLWDIHIFLRGGGISVGTLLLFTFGLFSFLLGLIAEQLSLIRKNQI